MHVKLVHVQVKPDRVDDFIEACRVNHVGSIEEIGNRRFDILQDSRDPTKFILYEAYVTAEQAEAHKETQHYKQWRDAVTSMMARPREGVPYDGLFPVD